MILLMQIPSRLRAVKFNIKILFNMNYNFHKFSLIHNKESISWGSLALCRYLILDYNSIWLRFSVFKMARWSIKSIKWVWALRISIQFHFQVQGFQVKRFRYWTNSPTRFQKIFLGITWSALEFCWNSFFLICGSNIVDIVVTISSSYVDRRFLMDYNKLIFNASPTEVCNWCERFPSGHKVRTSMEFEMISQMFHLLAGKNE